MNIYDKSVVRFDILDHYTIEEITAKIGQPKRIENHPIMRMGYSDDSDDYIGMSRDIPTFGVECNRESYMLETEGISIKESYRKKVKNARFIYDDFIIVFWNGSAYISFDKVDYFKDLFPRKKNGLSIYGKKISMADLLVDEKITDIIYSNILGRIENKDIYQKHNIPLNRGLIFYGPPGTGKTSIVLCLINQIKGGVNFRIITADDVAGQDFTFKEVFNKLRDANREDGTFSILLLEDADIYLRERGNDSNGPGSRHLSQLLQEMDGLERNNGIFVILTTNHVDKLDEAIRRPGRFDVSIEMKKIEETMNVKKLLDIRFKLGIDYNQELFLRNIEQLLPLTPAEVLNYMYLACDKAIGMGNITDDGIFITDDNMNLIFNIVSDYVTKTEQQKPLAGFKR